MSTNSEARKRIEERQANCVCKTVQFEGAKRDTVTIEISREDAEELVRVVEERDDFRSWLHGTSWTFASELRLKAKLQAALAGES